MLDSIDGYAFAKERGYALTDDATALGQFRAARRETLALLAGLREEQLRRPAVFEGSSLTVRGLVHHLCKHDFLHLAGLQWLLAKVDEARAGDKG